MDVFKALRMAIQSEIDVQTMYARLAEEVSDPEAKSLFSYLAEREIAHHQFLEAEFRALAAARDDKRGRPSHWLKQLGEEVQAVLGSTAANGETAATDPERCRLNLFIAENIAKTLENANAELLQKQARYEQELAIAAGVQKNLLPQELPQSRDIQIAASNIMARSVGGDYYDFVTKKGNLALVVADSMGKGMPAALLMTTVRAMWRSYSTTDSASPGQTLEMINQAVYPDLKTAEAFVTMFSALYDPETSIFQYSNAGHNPPLFRPALAPRCTELDVGNAPVGIFPDPEFPSGEFLMREGDVIVIYTDGVVEATDGNDNLFGVGRLCGLVEQNHRLDAEGIKSAILSEVDSHTDGSPQADDITLVVLKKI
jgi:serine phosphatase RsbU (regulator of sigma subunit)